MLNASNVPDEVTVASKWSQPPKIGRSRQFPTDTTENYSTTDFPEIQKKPRRVQDRNGSTPTTDNSTGNSSRQKATGKNADQHLTNSNVSATSAGTSFTKEDGQSLFTTLAESFIEDMKSQTAQQNQTKADLIANHVKRDTEHRTEQAEQRKIKAEARKDLANERREQTAQISQLLTLFANTSIAQQGSSQNNQHQEPRRRRHHRKYNMDTEMQTNTGTAAPTPFSTMNSTQTSNSPQRSMDTDSPDSDQ
jgi:hypothetical protein